MNEKKKIYKIKFNDIKGQENLCWKLFLGSTILMTNDISPLYTFFFFIFINSFAVLIYLNLLRKIFIKMLLRENLMEKILKENLFFYFFAYSLMLKIFFFVKIRRRFMQGFIDESRGRFCIMYVEKSGVVLYASNKTFMI